MSTLKKTVIVFIAFFCFVPASAIGAPNTIKVGIIASLTGAFAAVGNGSARAILLSCDKWNNDNAAKNSSAPHLECIVEDDGFDPKRAVAAFNKLTQVDHIDALIQGSSSPGVLPLIRANGLPTTHVFMEAEAGRDDNIFSICPEVEIAEKALGEAVAKKYGTSVAVVMTINDAVTRLAEAFDSGLGAKATRYEIAITDSDVRSLVTKIVHSKPSAIVFILSPSHGVAVEKELRKLAVKIPRVFDANFLSGLDEYRMSFGSLDGFKEYIFLDISMANTPERLALKNAYKAKYNEDLPQWSELGYDSLTVLMNAYDKDRAKWIDNLRHTSIEGTSGKIEFSAVGVTKPVYKITTVGEYLDRTDIN